MYHPSSFLVIKIAYLYYVESRPENDIAHELGISVPTVSRLLKRAKDEKIVDFVIREPYAQCLTLEKELKTAFHLKDVIISPAPPFAPEHPNNAADAVQVKKCVALEGARYLQRIIRKGDVLGMTWGGTMYYLINALNPSQRVDAAFVTLHGSLSCCVTDWDVSRLVARSAKAFSGRSYVLLTDALLSSPEIAAMLKKERNIARVYEMFKHTNIAVSGVGSFYPRLDSVLAQGDFLTDDEIRALQAEHVVGDMGMRFINAAGNECDTSLRDRTIAMDVETYRQIDRKILVASDPKKAQTVLSVLRGHLADVLIIDSQLGQAILSLLHPEAQSNPS
jgi:DNA-binding transcriptional regulator LsrR (DeoR family)